MLPPKYLKSLYNFLQELYIQIANSSSENAAQFRYL
jgi:hypothetical protein